MTDKQKYKKLKKQYRKLFINLAKQAAPYDYNYSLAAIILHLQYMKDYYTLGYNVWGEDTDGMPTRLESITEALNIYNSWQDCDKKYHIFHETGGIANGQGLFIDNKQQDWWVEPLLKDEKENYLTCEKEKQELKKKFFDYIADHIEEWWD